jgi:hypothetical protein
MGLKMVVEVGDRLLNLREVAEPDFRLFTPADMVGIPVVFCFTKDDGLRLWPKPLKICTIWRLEPQVHAETPA